MLCSCSCTFFHLHACLWVPVTDRDAHPMLLTDIRTINRVWEGQHQWAVGRGWSYRLIARHLNHSDQIVKMCWNQWERESTQVLRMGSERGRQATRRPSSDWTPRTDKGNSIQGIHSCSGGRWIIDPFKHPHQLQMVKDWSLDAHYCYCL